jgi:hypothetical protein
MNSQASSLAKSSSSIGMREHRRAERRRVHALRPRALPLDPGEELRIGRVEPVPDMLDLVRVEVAEARDRRLGETGRDADPELAGDQLEERPAADLVQSVEPGRDEARQLGLAGGCEALNHLGQGRDVRKRTLRRDRLSRGVDRLGRIVVADGGKGLDVLSPPLRGRAGEGGRAAMLDARKSWIRPPTPDPPREGEGRGAVAPGPRHIRATVSDRSPT